MRRECSHRRSRAHLGREDKFVDGDDVDEDDDVDVLDDDSDLDNDFNDDEDDSMMMVVMMGPRLATVLRLSLRPAIF